MHLSLQLLNIMQTDIQNSGKNLQDAQVVNSSTNLTCQL